MKDDAEWLRLVKVLEELGIPQMAKDVKNFWFDGVKYSRYQYDNIANELDKDLAAWQDAVQDAVGIPLPDKYKTSKGWLARPASNKYPFSVSGDLKENIDYGVKLHTTDKGNISIRAWAEITSPTSALTDAGKTRFKRKAEHGTPKWWGWRDRVFNVGDPEYNIISVSDIFDSMSKTRRKERDLRGLS